MVYFDYFFGAIANHKTAEVRSVEKQENNYTIDFFSRGALRAVVGNISQLYDLYGYRGFVLPGLVMKPASRMF